MDDVTKYQGTEDTPWSCQQCGQSIFEGEDFVMILPEDSEDSQFYCGECYGKQDA